MTQSGSDPTPLPNEIVEVSENQFCHKKAQLFPVVPSIAKPTIVVCVAAPANGAQPTWSSDSQFIYFLLPWDDPGVFRVRVSDGNAERVVDLKGFRLDRGVQPLDGP